MTDYIKREDATEVYSKLYWMHDGLLNFQEELGKVYDEILSIPPADVAPVRHGCWQITDAYPHNVYCSECHTKCAQTHWAVWEDGSLPRRYCPNCGARMDERKDDEVHKNG